MHFPYPPLQDSKTPFHQLLPAVSLSSPLKVFRVLSLRALRRGASVMSQILTKGGVLSDKLSDNSPQLQRSGHRVEGR
ncbi:60 kDa chaperonin 1 [Dissostichus eleginoides]|uniref:60 kDa chaperonin 1 n=1 Tax=Dissostichus eleginoides TaxID=100907 RepID=A0AAD9BPY6_DISEL|nr:60 kDa chaperonin 1 [Dissostichus eleginoides]